MSSENSSSEMNQGVSIISDEELTNDLEGIRQRFCTKLDMGDDPACIMLLYGFLSTHPRS